MSRMVATTIETIDGWTRMVYHGTCVAKKKLELCEVGNGKSVCTYRIVLNTGGYSTVTTKRRMNQFAKMFDLGFTVCQEDYEWYVNFKDGMCQKFDGNTCEFTVPK